MMDHSCKLHPDQLLVLPNVTQLNSTTNVTILTVHDHVLLNSYIIATSMHCKMVAPVLH